MLLYHGGDSASLITFKGTILDQVFPCFIAQIYHWYFKVLCIYILRMKGVNRNGNIKGNDVVAKLLFLISMYEFPLLL